MSQPSELSCSRFGFIEAVIPAFEFLVTEYNMKLVSSDPTLACIRYESRRVFLEVWHSQRSYELDVCVGRKRRTKLFRERPYELGSVLRAILGAGHGEGTGYESANAEGVKASVQDMAETVKKYYGPVLRSDLGIFCKILWAKERMAGETMKDYELRQVREKASRAWQDKDYRNVVKLYKSIKSDLLKSEAKKLEYARKQLRAKK